VLKSLKIKRSFSLEKSHCSSFAKYQSLYRHSHRNETGHTSTQSAFV